MTDNEVVLFYAISKSKEYQKSTENKTRKFII